MLPEEERATVARALAKAPQERWSSCSAFVEALADADRTLPPPKRRPRVLRVGVLCLALLLTVLAFAFWPRRHEAAPGEPARATWQPAEQAQPAIAKEPPPPARSYSFVFDGKSRIITPLERFAPVTLEAWVYPEPVVGGRRERTIIGSDIPRRSGIGIGIAYHDRLTSPVLGTQILPSPTDRDVGTSQPVPLRRWSHVAAVFGVRQTTVFFDGRLVARGAPSGNVGGTPFVIGNAGKTNREHYFVGRIRAVRISRGARYARDFTPGQAFEPDGEAVLIYDAGKTEGTKALDLSGHGNHGVMNGVRVELDR
jgi:hypothetical protein